MNKGLLLVGLAGIGYFMMKNTSASSASGGGDSLPTITTFGAASSPGETKKEAASNSYTYNVDATMKIPENLWSTGISEITTKKEEKATHSSGSSDTYKLASLTPASIEQQRRLVSGIVDTNVGQTKKESAIFNPNLNIPSNLTEKFNASGNQTSLAPAFNFDLISNVATKKETASSRAWWQIW